MTAVAVVVAVDRQLQRQRMPFVVEVLLLLFGFGTISVHHAGSCQAFGQGSGVQLHLALGSPKTTFPKL